MKKVLFLAEELRVGGAETYMYNIENNINRDDVDFELFAVDGEQKKNLKYLNKYHKYSFSNIDRYFRVYKFCKNTCIDIIHTNSLRLTIIASLIKRKFNIPIIYTKHNVTIMEKLSKKKYANFLNKNIDLVNVICDSERRYLESIGVNNKIIKVNYNGINMDDFPAKINIGTIKRIGILARLSIEKNHLFFLDIANEIHKKNNKIIFFIGGDGPERAKIEKYILLHQMESYVKCCGYVNANDFLNNIDCLMLVSQREVLPMSIIEAMSKKVLVVSKNLGGICELIDNKSGYLINSNKCSAYVDTILSIDNKYVSLVENARKKCEKSFSMNAMLLGIERMYDEVLKE